MLFFSIILSASVSVAVFLYLFLIQLLLLLLFEGIETVTADVRVTGGCVTTAGSTALWKTTVTAIWNLYARCSCWYFVITGVKTAIAFSNVGK